MKYRILVLLMSACLFSTGVARADSERVGHRFGIQLGILEPFPSVISGNLAFNLFDYLRLSAGYGYVSTYGVSLSTFAAGAKLFVPWLSLSPTLGLSWAFVNLSGTFTGGAVSAYGFPQSGNHIYGNVGLDYMNSSGFDIGVGWNQSFLSGIGGYPYVLLGFFF